MLDVDRARYFAQKPASAKDGKSIESPQRERGLWSFLTWSFFLSQLAVGNAFAGGAAQSASGDSSAPGSADSAAVKTANALGPTDFRAFAGEDPQSAALPDAAARAHADASAAGPEFGGIERLDLTGDTTTSVARSLATQGGGASEGGAIQPDVPPDVGPGIELPPINVELPPLIGVPPVLEGLLPPVLETIENLVDSLGPTLDGLLVPVVETVEDLVGVLGPTLDIVLSSMDTLVDDLTSVINPTIDTILAPVESVVDATLPAIEPVLDVAAPILDVLQPVTGPILAILPLTIGGGLPLGGVDGGDTDVMVSPGDLHFAVNVDPVVHELFQAGAYTEYGLEMQQTAASAENGVGELLGNIALPIEALFGDDDDASGGPQTFFGGLQHEAGLRGLADGLM